ncbi:3'-5' exonuclease [Leptolyngbya sp. FACHB-321]|uniref:3'-5' exonuclease n=1 Tax=Leptolyngbya sp. FACHB-321 TaxID=2692807 RepID=UPI001687ABFC|nr:3'-5' exonuclease [Leptolyngbya sp. FACHB-321]MBD2036995.1 3'-5' exonuclease [Leptolyngbya sp. FACHB-321]
MQPTDQIPWYQARYKVIDLEGNGFQPPDIVELAIVTLEQGVITSVPTVWLLKPEQPITRFATKIHHITNKDVTSSPSFEEVQNEIEQELQDDYIIAHNASVDYKVLSRKLPTWKPKGILDTLKLSKKILPGMKSYSLSNLTEQLSINLSDTNHSDSLKPHRAGYDSLIAAHLFLYLLAQQSSINTVFDLLSISEIK